MSESERCPERWELEAIGVMSTVQGTAGGSNDFPQCTLLKGHVGNHKAERSWPDFPGMGDLLEWESPDAR